MIAIPPNAYDNQHGILIVLPPKNGTTSLVNMLCHNDRKAFLVIDPRRDKHGCSIPAMSRGWEVAMVVRRPLERAIGLWKYSQQFEDTIDFETFARSLAKRHWFYCPQSFFADSVKYAGHPFTRQDVSRLIRLSNLLVELSHLGILTKPILSNVSDGNKPDVTPAALDHVRAWAKEDYRRDYNG